LTHPFKEVFKIKTKQSPAIKRQGSENKPK
jgi:hypothetical protein